MPLRRKTINNESDKFINILSIVSKNNDTIMHYTASCKFLLYFFLQIYGLELLMQIYVLIYSIFNYDEDAEPYKIIYIDTIITLLMSVEIISHYNALVPKKFWNNQEILFDLFVSSLSGIFIILYVIHKENIIEVPEETSKLFHFFRDIIRILRIPGFTRNFYRMLKCMHDINNKTLGDILEISL